MNFYPPPLNEDFLTADEGAAVISNSRINLHSSLIDRIFVSVILNHMTRLYIIDDHYLIIEGLYTAFDLESDDFEVVGGSLSVDEALNQINPERVDILLLDLFIGNSDPIINLIRVTTAFPGIPVVIISHESCMLWQVEMFRFGVRAYINKGDPKSEMVGKLNIVASGQVVMPNHVAKVLLTPKDEKSTSAYFSDFKEIITALSVGLTVKEIASRMNQTESAIEKKLQWIRKCYDAKTNSELVYKAMIKLASN
jgi:DNA-binding NarL/FixJ family response regulator